jgi:D-lactate dehydrogenase (cytochrome)
MIDTSDADKAKRAGEFTSRLAMRAISMERTCTGEHGVGQGKIKFLEAEYGAALEYIRAVKKAFDPLNIINPGKIVSSNTKSH